MLPDAKFLDDPVPSSKIALTLRQAATGLQTAIEELEAFKDDFAARINLFNEHLKNAIKEAKEIVREEPFPELEAAKDLYLQKELLSAERLEEFRTIRNRHPASKILLLSDIIQNIEDLMVERCEIFRDARWEFMAIRAENSPNDKPVFLTSVADIGKRAR